MEPEFERSYEVFEELAESNGWVEFSNGEKIRTEFTRRINLKIDLSENM